MEERWAGVKWNFSWDFTELGRATHLWQSPFVSLSEIQAQAAALSVEDRRKLAAYLVMLRMKEAGDWDRAVRENAPDHEGWVSLEDAKRRLLGEN
jgi:hypothetical protein